MTSIYERIPWHEGENEMHKKLHVPYQENPTSSFLTPYCARSIRDSPLLALGTLDEAGRPWTTLLGGEAGFARPLGQSIVGIRTLVDPAYDPVVRSLLGRKHEENSTGQSSQHRAVSALSIDIATRSRYKFAGTMVAAALDQVGNESSHAQASCNQGQMVIKVEQSIGMKSMSAFGSC